MAAGWTLSAPDRGVIFGGDILPAQLKSSEFLLSERSGEREGRIAMWRWKSNQRARRVLEGSKGEG